MVPTLSLPTVSQLHSRLYGNELTTLRTLSGRRALGVADNESTKAKDLPVSITRTAEALMIDERGCAILEGSSTRPKFQSLPKVILSEHRRKPRTYTTHRTKILEAYLMTLASNLLFRPMLTINVVLHLKNYSLPTMCCSTQLLQPRVVQWKPI